MRLAVVIFLATLSAFDFTCPADYVRYQKDKAGFWSQWSPWSQCTVTSICEGGTRTRDRKCLARKDQPRTCTGEYVELEGCPKTDCNTIKPMIYTDIAEASLSSFISQECNTDIKYSVASKHGNKIPQSILSKFKLKLMHFLHGFFNVEKFLEKPEIKLKNMTKVCFEPRDLQVKDLPSIYRFNRVVKASLLKGGKRLKPDDVIEGVTVVVEDDDGKIHGIYFAMKGANFGYKTVGYRRWMGQGVLETL